MVRRDVTITAQPVHLYWRGCSHFFMHAQTKTPLRVGNGVMHWLGCDNQAGNACTLARNYPPAKTRFHERAAPRDTPANPAEEKTSRIHRRRKSILGPS